MGTRADFYVGQGEQAEWLGSIAYDGFPEGILKSILKSSTEKNFRLVVTKELKGREDGTLPEMGWPWPWEDSQTTDYAYAFVKGSVVCSCFGSTWFNPLTEHSRNNKEAVFPNMKARQKVTFGSRSGLLIIGGE